jgi:hypothetical protein
MWQDYESYLVGTARDNADSLFWREQKLPDSIYNEDRGMWWKNRAGDSPDTNGR